MTVEQKERIEIPKTEQIVALILDSFLLSLHQIKPLQRIVSYDMINGNQSRTFN